ncbi:MAG: outer membrane protein assembly factor BamB [Zoogloeaceae bacterium]|jgi:outer membrane protein assembly factor BamB|nr:outer membrane protein assembly factor BamB [Zoogloeaceae bacterium]
MRLIVYRSVMLAAAVLIGGCSGGTKIKPAELTPIAASTDLAERWHGKVGGSDDFVFAPAIVDDSVYAAGQDGVLTRYDNGREIWRISVGDKLSGGVGSDGRLAVVGTQKGDVYAYEAETGKLRWKTRASSEVLAAPVVDDTLVVVRSGDSRIAALDVQDGKRRWLFQRAMPTLALRTHVSVLMGETVVVAGFPGGKLVAINKQSGAAIWEVSVALPKGATELERIADLSSLPVVQGRDICAAAFQGRVACFDITTGNMSWSRDISSSAGMDMDNKRVYVSDDKGAVHAFARDTGASLWKQNRLFMRALTRPLAMDGRVAVADYQGVVHLLDAATGEFVARAKTDGSPVRAELQRFDGGLLVQTLAGGLYAFFVR